MPDLLRTRPSNKYLLKTAIFLVLFGAFGTWGLYDALIKYPENGRKYADYALYVYLTEAQKASQLYNTSIADPKAVLAQLSSGLGVTSNADLAKKNWLEALDLIAQLTPEHTVFEPQAKLAELAKVWTTATPPAKLNSLDFAFQWVFVVVGYGISLWILVIFVKVVATGFKWDSESNTLHLSSGHKVTPIDLAELDKSQWHKFIVFLRLVEGHPLANSPVRLDLYRHEPLESWVLQLESIRFPDLQRAGSTEDAPAATDPEGENPKTP